MRKTSLQIIREPNGTCLINVKFSDKDKALHNDQQVLYDLLKDASTEEFYNFILPTKPEESNQ
jgi:hypothetical protein